SMAAQDGQPEEQAALLVAAVLAHQKKRRPATIDAPSGEVGSWKKVGRDRFLEGRQAAQRRGWRQHTS
ncbi:MAG: hypothetical protein WD939_06605, partial [Dehalococcoidia bacterium]